MHLKTALITDLDNTLFDWVDLWHKCFSAMLAEIVRISGLPREKLIPEIRTVHQKHGTSEYAFLIEELPSLTPMLKGRPATEVFGPAIEAYRTERRANLKLFPTVGDTLLKIKGRGTRIVGYTESMGFYSNYRIRRLGLDGVLDYVFCPEDHALPAGMTLEQTRAYPASHYELHYTKQLYTPAGSKKPDVTVLNAIIDQLGLPKHDCVYVGDNVSKDVAMAIDCGVEDVWAEYGQAHRRPEYELLKQVTHWTRDEVRREARINAREHVNPTHTLSRSYSDLMNLFEFRDFHRQRKPSEDKKNQVIEIWKKIVDVQQHFNDIEMRIRAMFVTILIALFASIGFLLDKRFSFPLGSFSIQFATIIPILGIFGAFLFYFIDRYWYHRLLVGSVKHAMTIETEFRDDIPELSLSDAIGQESPFKPQGWFLRALARLLVREKTYKEKGILRSDGKIELFYKSVMVLLLIIAIVIAFMGGITKEKSHDNVPPGIITEWDAG